MLDGYSSVSRDDANDHAKTEYTSFETRRHTLLEAQGEKDAIKALEEAAASLSTNKPK